MKTTTTILLSLCFCISSFAQDYKFGKVSKEELQEKFNPLDSSASATYLYKKRKTSFKYQQGEGFQLVTEIHERIKIYNQEGFDYTTHELLLFHRGGKKEKISSIKAYTYNLINGKIEEVKLQKDGIFNTEYNEYRDLYKFTMPNIKEGCVIEYKYAMTSPFISNIDDFVFQHDIPIKKLDARFEAPEYFNFKVNTKGFLSVIPKKDVSRSKITVKSESLPQAGGKVEKWQNEIVFTENISSYSLSDIPALKEESYVDNINNYRSAVKYELSYVKMPHSTIKYYSTTWEDVVKTIYESSNFGLELEKANYFKDDVDALISSISDPIQKASLIFDFVKSKVRWNGYYGKYCSDGVRKAYKDQVGNVAEVNLMLTAMLRHAGLNANPVLVSTRHNGIPLFPTREGYNYVISSIEIPEGTILLDATSKYSTPNVLPLRTLNWEGRIVRKDKTSSTISLYPNVKSENKVMMLAKLTEDGNVEGGVRRIKKVHKAMTFREDYLGTDEDQYIEKLEKKYDGMEMSDFIVKNGEDLSKPISESFKFSIESQADVINDKIYFSPLLFFKTKENPFKLEKREFPVDFGYPSSTSYSVSLSIPSGYKVESTPEPVMLMLPDNLGSYKYIISVKQNKIQLVIQTEINESRISPIHYEALKAYFSDLVEKESEQIVLTKKVL
ncbi:transglutaminase domain-containing protein [Thalassobellus sediminis]|uniref:transglutaminase domain-containing protein n=1 Tax=Thalassobellus sediminis TaxID=3367753 RepID=UPI00379D9E9B